MSNQKGIQKPNGKRKSMDSRSEALRCFLLQSSAIRTGSNTLHEARSFKQADMLPSDFFCPRQNDEGSFACHSCSSHIFCMTQSKNSKQSSKTRRKGREKKQDAKSKTLTKMVSFFEERPSKSSNIQEEKILQGSEFSSKT